VHVNHLKPVTDQPVGVQTNIGWIGGRFTGLLIEIKLPVRQVFAAAVSLVGENSCAAVSGSFHEFSPVVKA